MLPPSSHHSPLYRIFQKIPCKQKIFFTFAAVFGGSRVLLKYSGQRKQTDSAAGKLLQKATSGFTRTNIIAAVAQLVEHQLPKLRVAGSSPVSRSGKIADVAQR